jgi:hypothetical protein
VCRDLGLRRSGVRERTRQLPISAISLPGNWYVIEDYCGSTDLLDTDLLTRLSRDCEVVVCAVTENIGWSQAAGWADGEPVWSVIRHPDADRRVGIVTTGALPPEFGEVRRAHPETTTTDLPVELAVALTGYRHETTDPAWGERPFEVLDTPESARRVKRLTAAVVDAVTAAGYVPATPPDGSGLWFLNPDVAICDVTAAARVDISRDCAGNPLVALRASLTSPAVADVIAGIPDDALSEQPRRPEPPRDELDSVAFGPYRVRDDAGTDGVRWLTERLRDPIGEWFAARDGLPQLVALAKAPRWGRWVWGSIDPQRWRATVVLCLLNGRPDEAAALMRWYLRGLRFDSTDSSSRVAAFDAELRARFPAYAVSRQRQ